jgi:hypothetical protein
MQTTVFRLSKKFLREIDSKSETIEVLGTMIGLLENKPDPDPSELYLLESLYRLKENLTLVESRLNSYVIESRRSLPGNKLNDLYDGMSPKGTSNLFND